MRYLQRHRAAGCRIEYHDLNCGTVLGITDVRIPVLRHFAGNRLVRKMDNKNVIIIVIRGFHRLRLQYEIVHDSFDDNYIFNYQNCTHEIVASAFKMLKCPQVGGVLESSGSCVNDLN
jgi:hypothetical protein